MKHTFLDTYMPAQIPKDVSWADEFTYVDLFAGPWQSKSDDYADTSFGIALRRMTEAKVMQAKIGRRVKMVAQLRRDRSSKLCRPDRGGEALPHGRGPLLSRAGRAACRDDREAHITPRVPICGNRPEGSA